MDVVVDSIGGAITAEGLQLLAPFGRLVIYGAASGAIAEVPVRALHALRSVAGFGLLPWRAARPSQAREEMAELAEHAAAGRLRVAVSATLPLAEAARAQALLEDREPGRPGAAHPVTARRGLSRQASPLAAARPTR